MAGCGWGAGVRVGGRGEPRASLSGPGPALRDPRPAFGCCALSLEFPSGSFLGAPRGGGAIRLGPRLRGAPGRGPRGPGLVRGGGALLAGQGLAPGGRVGVARRGGGGGAWTARGGGPGAGWGSPGPRAPAGGLFGAEVSSHGRPWRLLQLEPAGRRRGAGRRQEKRGGQRNKKGETFSESLSTEPWSPASSELGEAVETTAQVDKLGLVLHPPGQHL